MRNQFLVKNWNLESFISYIRKIFWKTNNSYLPNTYTYVRKDIIVFQKTLNM